MDDVVEALRAARDRLRERLRSHPEFQDYEAVSAMVARYEAAEASERIPPRNENPPPPSEKPLPFRRTETGMVAVQQACEEYLRRKGSRATSPELLVEMARLRLMREDQVGVLSSYLSRGKAIFDNERGQGYGLLEWKHPKAATPDSGELSGAPKSNGVLPLNV